MDRFRRISMDSLPSIPNPLNSIPSIPNPITSISNISTNVFKSNEPPQSDAAVLAYCQRIIDEKSVKKADAKTLKQVIAAASHEREDIKVQGLLAMVNLTENDDNKKGFVGEGALPLIVSCCHAQNEKVQYAAARVLWNISKLSDLKRNILNSNALPAIEVVAGSPVSNVQYVGARIVLHLAEDVEPRKHILDTRIPARLVDFLSVETEQLQIVAANALQFLAETAPHQTLQASEKMLERLLHVTKTSSGNLQYATLTTLRTLCKYSGTAAVFKELRGVEVLVGLLRDKSRDERIAFETLSFLADLNLSEVELQDQLTQHGVMEGVLAMLRSSKPLLVAAAANFVKAYARSEKVGGYVVDKIGFNAMLDLMKSANTALIDPAASVLISVLKQPKVCVAFVAQGGLDAVTAMMKLTTNDKLTWAAVSIMWIVLAVEDHCSIVSLRPESLKALVNLMRSPNISTCVMAGLCFSRMQCSASAAIDDVRLALGRSGGVVEIHMLASSSDWAVESHLEWLSEDVRVIVSFSNSSVPEVRLFATWTLAHISSQEANRQVMLQSGGVGVLERESNSDNQDTQSIAIDALKKFETRVIGVPADIPNRIRRFLKDIDNENQLCNDLVKSAEDLSRRVQSVNTQALHDTTHFVATPATPPLIAQKISAAKATRQQSIEEYKHITAEANQALAAVRSLIRPTDEAEKLKAKSQDKERLDAMNTRVAELKNQHDQEVKTQGKLLSERDELEASVTKLSNSLDELLLARPRFESRRIDMSNQIIELQFKLDHPVQTQHQLLADNMVSRRNEMDGSISRLLRQQEEISQEVVAMEAKIAQINSSMQGVDERLEKFRKLKDTNSKLRELRRDLQAKYGAQLVDYPEFFSLLDSLVRKGADQLKELGRTPPPILSASTGSKDQMAHQIKLKEEALDKELQALEIELNSQKETLAVAKRDSERAIETKRPAQTKLTTEVDGLRKSIDIIEAKTQSVPSAVSETDLRNRIAKLKTDLDGVEKELTQMNTKIRSADDLKKEQSTRLFEIRAKIRKSETVIAGVEFETSSTEIAYRALLSKVEAELNATSLYLADLKTKRAEVQGLIRPIGTKLSKWEEFKDQERTQTQEIYNQYKQLIQSLTEANAVFVSALDGPWLGGSDNGKRMLK